MLTAEKLFAERGIDRVSIRQINLAAGQKNSSATQYHFGTKIALLEALFDYRMEPINQHRLEMLRELEAAGDTDNLQRLIGALVQPLAEQLKSQGAGYYYIPIVAQVIGHPNYHEIARHRSHHGAGLQWLLTLIKKNLPVIPEALILQRFGMALRQVFNELADYQRLNLSGPVATGTGMPLFISGLVDAVTAQFAAPVSAATLQEFEKKQQKSA
ncbi:MAG: helix-turn-helix domain-containing protein [Gammaproteobacteria bacterium]|nr:helix-turn-helix domain-containing protein [Gammaproteobacteria bacterium]